MWIKRSNERRLKNPPNQARAPNEKVLFQYGSFDWI